MRDESVRDRHTAICQIVEGRNGGGFRDTVGICWPRKGSDGRWEVVGRIWDGEIEIDRVMTSIGEHGR